MHFGDIEHIEEAVLKVVMYKHINMDSDSDFYPDIQSIYEAKYIGPWHIQELREGIIHQGRKYQELIDSLVPEKWYLVTFRINDNGDLYFTEKEDVSDDHDDPFLKLH